MRLNAPMNLTLPSIVDCNNVQGQVKNRLMNQCNAKNYEPTNTFHVCCNACTNMAEKKCTYATFADTNLLGGTGCVGV